MNTLNFLSNLKEIFINENKDYLIYRRLKKLNLLLDNELNQSKKQDNRSTQERGF